MGPRDKWQLSCLLFSKMHKLWTLFRKAFNHDRRVWYTRRIDVKIWIAPSRPHFGVHLWWLTSRFVTHRRFVLRRFVPNSDDSYPTNLVVSYPSLLSSCFVSNSAPYSTSISGSRVNLLDFILKMLYSKINKRLLLVSYSFDLLITCTQQSTIRSGQNLCSLRCAC